MVKKIELGDEVRDTITGFKGVAIARTQWITGCNRINVQPKVKKDGTLAEPLSFDEPMLEITKQKRVKTDNERGGPRMTMINTKF